MAGMPRNKLAAGIVVGLLVTLAAGTAFGWLARSGKVTDLEKEVARLNGELAAGDSQESTESAESTETTQAAPAQTAQPPAAEEPAPTPGTRETTGVNERQPGYVKAVNGSAGNYVMSIDYVQFLTGGEAADAAALHGDDSPPPNDYYIVNDNPKIRDFPVQPGIQVFVVTNSDGTSDANGHVITLAQWVAALRGPQGSEFMSTLYWVTVTNGTVTKIEAQYLP